MKQLKNFSYALMTFTLLFSACSKDDDPIQPDDPNAIVSTRLDFIEVTGHPHGDHFHDLAEIEGEKDSITIEFDQMGIAKNGHIHLDPHKIYRLQLYAFNGDGHEVQDEFLANKAVADQYKAFIVGGDFKLNPETGEAENGALFQPREQTYGDGAKVDGKYETTGILAYFSLGEANEGADTDVSYILRRFADHTTKAKIERTDWNHDDYASKFVGEDVLKLTFELHAVGHDH
ncbi:hypothetical protein RYH73_15900 [Olivibacter sp. CPCC 100613]|uniref:hypothetical protein n=1 Tax=Olivibacter sp. CPCC 100613 TaxID=3079931 RepID=UPI002FF4F23D